LASKIDAVVPEGGRIPEGGWGFAVYPFADSSNAFHLMPGIRKAVRSKTKLTIVYSALSGAETRRTIRPLNLEYWGKIWTCTAWCELRTGFRVFRVDRVLRMTVEDQIFVDEPGKRYEDYLATVDPS
jgi:predicted DNA-binding transcriptional regulator YafY